MTGEPTLVDQRLAVVEQLREQRLQIAGQLDAGGQGRFPRSMTLRLLISRPEFVFKLVGLIARSRVITSSIAVAVIVHLLWPRAAGTQKMPGDL